MDNPQPIDNPTPLTVLAGFLGAGKTTLLNRILNGEHTMKIAVLVNDFGAINIDAALIVDVSDEEDTITLSNGCICCTIRDDLLDATLGLIQRDDPPDYIVVEASGVSDTIDVALAFRYMRQIKINSIISVIDAEQFIDVTHEHRVLAMNQIGMADIILLNKVDLVSDDKLSELQKYIYELMPRSRVLETVHCDVPLELLFDTGNYNIEDALSQPKTDIHVHSADEHHHDHEHTDHATVFDTWNWTSTEPLSFRALKHMTEALPLNIYRAKGLFFLADEPNRRAVLHIVGKRVELKLEHWDKDSQLSQFVVIGTHGDVVSDELQSLLDACLAKNAPKSEIEKLADSALSWLRQKRGD
jgi:G3E family GTPase